MANTGADFNRGARAAESTRAFSTSSNLKKNLKKIKKAHDYFP